MQLTRVGVYNLTLGKIKVAERMSMVDDELADRYMLPQIYDLVLAQMLERHPWSFCTKTEKLAKSAENQEIILFATHYRHTWIYPHDCQKVLTVGHCIHLENCVNRTHGDGDGNVMAFWDNLPHDVVMGAAHDRVILTIYDHACIRYLSNGIPVARMPAGFIQALTWAMAAEITRAENASDSDADYRMQQAQIAFEAAQRADVLDNGGGLRVPGNWVLARSVYHYYTRGMF